MNEHFLLQAVRPLFLVPFYLRQVILVLLFKINLLFLIFKKNIKQIIVQVVPGKQKFSGWKERDGFLEPEALAVSILTCTYNLLSCSLACGPPDWELLGGSHHCVSRTLMVPSSSGCAVHTSCPELSPTRLSSSAGPGCVSGSGQKPLPHCLWSWSLGDSQAGTGCVCLLASGWGPASGPGSGEGLLVNVLARPGLSSSGEKAWEWAFHDAESQDFCAGSRKG